MRTLRLIALTAVAMLPDTPAVAADTPVKSKISGVDLFKNGLAIVKREVTLGKPGTYDLDDVPQPVHGTFWIDSTGTVDVVVKMRDVAVPASAGGSRANWFRPTPSRSGSCMKRAYTR